MSNNLMVFEGKEVEVFEFEGRFYLTQNMLQSAWI